MSFTKVLVTKVSNSTKLNVVVIPMSDVFFLGH